MVKTLLRKGIVGVAILVSATVHGLTLLGSSLLMYLLITQVEYSRIPDPTGEYEAVVTYAKIHSFLPAMPGQGSDMSGRIAIYDRNGNFYGGGSLDFVRDGYELEWTETGASLKFVGEWDFEAGTFSYWSNDDRGWVVKQIR